MIDHIKSTLCYIKLILLTIYIEKAMNKEKKRLDRLEEIENKRSILRDRYYEICAICKINEQQNL